MELKVLCNCGQKYKFDVEPVNNQMPFGVNCPVCGADGTDHANTLIAQSVAAPAVVLPPPQPRVTARAITRPASVPAPAQAKSRGEFNLGLGILGAFLGALLAAGALIGFSMAVGFRFPLFGTAIGLATGWTARWLYKGTDNTLGIASSVVALVFTGGALFVIYGEFHLLMLISMLVSVSFAWKLSSG
jgi:hypothetical protein